MITDNIFYPVPWSKHGRWLLILLLSVFSAVALSPVIAYADEPAFAQAIQVGEAKETRDIVVGDLNGDGFLDIVQGVLGQSYVFLYKEQGGFTEGVPLGDGAQTTNVDLGDLNGDGFLDIVQANYVSIDAKQTAIYLNDGKGAFPEAIPLGSPARNESVAVGDLNGDGFLDIVQGNDGISYLYLNDGQAVFTQSSPFAPANTQSLAVADLNGDGALDVVQGNWHEQSYIYLNDGQGGFTPGRPIGNKEANQSTTVGDLNGDGFLDIIMGNFFSTSPGSEQSYIYWNDGAGGFAQATPLGDHTNSQGIAVGDLNDDGFLDIIQANFMYPGYSDLPSQSYVYWNDGQGHFPVTGMPLGNGERSFSMAVGDFNKDGLLDIIQGNYTDRFGNYSPDYIYLNDVQAGFTQSRLLGAAKVMAQSVAVGDFNGDSTLDIIQGAFGPSYLYLNDGQGFFAQSSPLGSNQTKTNSIAVGDLNGDGSLDIVQGNVGDSVAGDGQSYIYLNNGQAGFTQTRLSGSNTVNAQSVAVGDLNEDGALDIVQGNAGQSYLYLNDGQGRFPQNVPFGNGERTTIVAVGDLNEDGALDIVQGNAGQSYVYLNDDQDAFTQPTPFGNGEKTTSVAVGDLNNDGALDIVQGNNGISYLYLNDGSGNFPASGVPLGNEEPTTSVAIGDLNGDGFLDIVQGNFLKPSIVYLNDRTGGFPINGIKFGTLDATRHIAVGDLNGDGRLDIIQANTAKEEDAAGEQSYFYLNSLWQATGLVNDGPYLTVMRPGPTGNANFFSSPARLSNATIPITYTLFDGAGARVGQVEASYSLNGGGKWLPAIATSSTVTTNLAASPTGVQHVYIWDRAASGIYGRADNIVFRLAAYHQPLPPSLPITNTDGGIDGPIQQPYASATTFPFSVQGLQIRVVDEQNQPIAGALIYRLSPQQFTAATPIADDTGQPLRTSFHGYLPVRSGLQIGDQLVALLPMTATQLITFTNQYSYYLTSAAPISTGLAMQEITYPGLITLKLPTTANQSYPLLLFNLTVSLEWDAGNDELFRVGLENGFKRASELLFKVSHGQAALGRVDVLPAKHFWNRADLILYASNSFRPSAAIGGVVNGPLDETVFANADPGAAKKLMRAAYIPGQIQIGAAWDPFGEEAGDLSEQWWRALAHELAHHLLFLPDNYVGFKIDPQTNRRLLGRVDCRGSFMTTTFDPSYTRFLDQPFWLGDCLQTLAAFSTGRSDWETITHFYPMLKPPVEPATALTQHEPPDGPNLLPLDVTQVVFWTLPDQRPTLPARYFQLRNSAGAIMRLPTARVYLFQTQGTDTPTDDVLLALGSPTGGGDRIKVRGGQPGDRLCLFDFGASDGQTYRGCLPALNAADASIPITVLDPAQIGARWAPAIEVRALTTRTLVITVTQPLTPNPPLNVQIFPAHYPSAPGLAPVAALTLTQGVYVGQVALPYPATDVFVRVWVEGSKHVEAISQFNLQLPWQPGDGVSAELEQAMVSGPDRPAVGGPDRPAVGGPDRPAVGGPDRPVVGGPDYPVVGGAPQYNFAAPMVSADAQVVIYNQEGFFEPNRIQSLQILPSPPALHDEPWLAPVGQAYLVEPQPGVTAQRTIAVTYLQKDVPEGYEQTLALYYLPRGGQQWQRLPTERFVENLVVADLQPEAGVYAVMSTIVLPPLQPGWNMIAYPLPDARPISDALRSIAGAYSVVYEPPSDVAALLRTFAGKPSAIADQLTAVKTNVDYVVFGHVYWIKVDQPVTLYLAPPRRTPDGAVPGD
jgi:hypothetical protein